MELNKKSMPISFSPRAGRFDPVVYFIFLRRLKKIKREQLWMAELDRQLFLKTYNDELNYNETADRTMLSEENKKADADRDLSKIQEAELRIAKAKEVKVAWRRNEISISEITEYLELLNSINTTPDNQYERID
jgi:hypothetical protein